MAGLLHCVLGPFSATVSARQPEMGAHRRPFRKGFWSAVSKHERRFCTRVIREVAEIVRRFVEVGGWPMASRRTLRS